MFDLTRKRDASDQDHVERVLAVIWVGFNCTPNRRGPLIQGPQGGQLPWSHHRKVNSSLRKKEMQVITRRSPERRGSYRNSRLG